MIYQQIAAAFKHLNPNRVIALADRPLQVGVFAPDESFFHETVGYLAPEGVSGAKARDAGRHILRLSSEEDFGRCDFGFIEPGLPHPSHFYAFDSRHPAEAVEQALDDQEELWLPAARRLPAFRDPVVERIIWKISKENALFTVATALPNVAPSLISLPWAVGEFASDTTVLTMNQVRMAFLIAAASDRDVGYSRQHMQIGSIFAAAFGWRAAARTLVSKVPAGGGLISKGLISLAGTYVVGKGLDRFFRIGQRLSREEKNRFYSKAYERGRDVVGGMAQRFMGRLEATGNA